MSKKQKPNSLKKSPTQKPTPQKSDTSAQANGDSSEREQAIVPDPPKTNNLIVLICGFLMVCWMVYLMIIAILAN